MGIREVQFAALLHDIGKFKQRSGSEGNHAAISSAFLERYFSKAVADIVIQHHSSIGEIKAENKDSVLIVKIADHISSGEREEREKGETGNPKVEPLLSIFCKVDIEKGSKPDDKYYPVSPLTLSGDIFPRDLKEYRNEKNMWNLQGEYKKLWKEFVKELERVGTDFETLYHLLWKYTWCIPSAVWKDIPDIALFDHLRTTAAIATCLKYQSLGEKSLENLFRGVTGYWSTKQQNDGKSLNELREFFKEKASREEYVEFIEKQNFVLIGGDISGIQNFIYNIKSPQIAQKGMAKRLRGRSFYLTLLGESIAHYILNRLSLPITNLLWCSGGHFYILAPKEFLKDLVEMEKELNTMMLREFQGELFIILGLEPGNAYDMIEFSQFLDRCKEKISEGKKRKALGAIKELGDLNLTRSILPKGGKIQTCSICGFDYIGEDNKKCQLCSLHKKIGSKLPKIKYLVEIITPDKPEGCDILFKFVREEKTRYIGWRISYKNPDIDFSVPVTNSITRVYNINATDLDISIPREVTRAFKFYGKIVPTDDGESISFDRIAKFSQGIERLGILRMDVDFLGRIFSIGLQEKNRTVSRISTLSRMLDMFFAGYLNNITERFSVFEGQLDTLCSACEERLSEPNVKILKSKIEFKDGVIKDYVMITSGGLPDAKLICSRCNRENKSIPLIYTTYSGGDDIFVVGPWDIILDFALIMREEFSRYVAENKNITISGGTFICRSRFPIGRAARIAGENLDNFSKKFPSKNAITVFGETVSWKCSSHNSKWNGFDGLLSYGRVLEDYTKDSKAKNIKISNSFLYSVLSFWGESFSDISRDRGYIPYEEAERRKSYLPRFKYLLARNFSRKTEEEEELFSDLDKNVPKIIPWARIPVNWALLRNRGEKKWK